MDGSHCRMVSLIIVSGAERGGGRQGWLVFPRLAGPALHVHETSKSNPHSKPPEADAIIALSRVFGCGGSNPEELAVWTVALCPASCGDGSERLAGLACLALGWLGSPGYWKVFEPM